MLEYRQSKRRGVDRPGRCAHESWCCRSQKVPDCRDEIFWRSLDRRDCGVAQCFSADGPTRLETCKVVAFTRAEPERNPMSPDRRRHIEQIVMAALDLESTKRAAYLDSACADEPELRQAVER